jgi:hypothetical protein
LLVAFWRRYDVVKKGLMSVEALVLILAFR